MWSWIRVNTATLAVVVSVFGGAWCVGDLSGTVDALSGTVDNLDRTVGDLQQAVGGSTR